MASLNLVPTLPVVVTQGVIFLGNMVLIKKLMIDPYMALRDRREAATTGSKEGAVKALAECEVLADQISTKLAAAGDEARKTREKIRDEALEKRQHLVGAAEREARATIDMSDKEIAAELTREKQRIPEIVKNLTNEVYQLALN